MKKTCKEFSLDLMHFSTNELKEIKDLAGLKAHLKECRKCQEKLAKLKELDVLSFVAKPRSEKYKSKMKKLMERVRSESSASQSLPRRQAGCRQEGDRNAKLEIDHAAVKIYDFVKVYTKDHSDKKVAIPIVREGTGFVNYPFYEATGVLTSDEKLLIAKDINDRPAYLCMP